MCTLVFALERPAPGWITVGANRDELYSRPSDPPRVLCEAPRVLGGRDRVARGTWLALRTTPPVRLAAVLNRWDHDRQLLSRGQPERYSRGLLCLEAAKAGSLAAAEAVVAMRVEESPVSPMSLVLIESGRCRIAYYDERGLRWDERDSGVHVITHGDVDEPSDGRVDHALGVISSWSPQILGDAGRLLQATGELLRHHDLERAVCLHGELAGTVSSTLISLDLQSGQMSWRYAGGPPCRHDYAELDAAAFASGVAS
jgi:hypothetical protein